MQEDNLDDNLEDLDDLPEEGETTFISLEQMTLNFLKRIFPNSPEQIEIYLPLQTTNQSYLIKHQNCNYNNIKLPKWIDDILAKYREKEQ